MYWYLLRDHKEFTGLGLVRDEQDPLGRYGPNPAYPAYAVLIDRLARARFVKREPGTGDAWVYRFADGGQEIRIAWAEKPTGYTVAASRPIRVTTFMGAERSAQPQGGSITLTVDENPLYIVEPR
jgi:hypothetical protein